LYLTIVCLGIKFTEENIMIVKYEIPIDDYYDDEDVFFKCVYFECDKVSLTLEKVKEAIQKEADIENEMEKTNPELGPYCHEYDKCIESLNAITRNSDFPILSEHNLIQASCYTIHPKHGKQVIFAQIITLLNSK
jgi:hypothetical protein